MLVLHELNIQKHSEPFQIDTTPPTRQYFNQNATSDNSYHASWIFKSPQTFSIVETGVTKYITFTTTFGDD